MRIKKLSKDLTGLGEEQEKKILTQMDWPRMSEYQQNLADKGYLDKAKNYLNNIQNKISQDNQKYGHSAYGAPYGDPAWSGGYTANVMKFQDYFHPTGVDRSNAAMAEIGQGLADKLQGGFETPAQQAQALGGMKRLESIGNKRGIDFNQPSVSEYLRLLGQGGY
jgi:hypothetical protein